MHPRELVAYALDMAKSGKEWIAKFGEKYMCFNCGETERIEELATGWLRSDGRFEWNSTRETKCEVCNSTRVSKVNADAELRPPPPCANLAEC